MLSYLVQSALTTRLNYWSLYEAQVPGRPDLPAHHVERLQAALRLLSERKVLTLDSLIGHLDLQALLASGITVYLPDGKQLAIGIIQAHSPWVGTPLHANSLAENESDIQIVTVIRQGEMLFPASDPILQTGDQVLVMASQQTWEQLTYHLAPLASS